jgi:hypothetical protein
MGGAIPRRFIVARALALGGLWLVLAPAPAPAFSLLGPFAPWMSPGIGYGQFAEIGGPVNLGEEYRWNVPVITYGFDQAFVDYFGARGVEEVEKAVQILNALPPASEIDPAGHAASSLRINFRAQAMNLLDLKSSALGVLLEQLGLAPPEQYVWTLRERRILPIGGVTTTNYFVVQRNFDPLTLAPSANVNDVTYNYVVSEFSAAERGRTDHADALEIPVQNPSIPAFNSVAGRRFQTGHFLGSNNLTRDDVGGLRYLLSRNNVNAEQLPAGVTAADGSQNFVHTALRPGVEKITFVRLPYDTVLGLSPPFTNRWQDTYFSNGIPRQQLVQRVVTRPDILFTAADTGLSPGLGGPVLVWRTGTSNWVNNAHLHSALGGDGPGVIQPGVIIAFDKLGQTVVNQPPYFLDAPNPLFRYAYWGTFDGTTNLPVVFPQGLQMPLNPTVSLTLESSETGPQLRWTVWGPPNGVYRVECTTDFVTWTEAATFTNLTGLVDFAAPVSEPHRFYRVVAE